MAILCDTQIIKYITKRNMIQPFNAYQVNPASYDLTLSSDLIEITPGGLVDPSTDSFDKRKLTSERRLHLHNGQHYVLLPGVFILASSVEVVSIPPELVGEVKLKSSTARTGIGHVFSGWIDPGFTGQITFELFSHVPVVLIPGKRIAQIVFMEMSEIPDKPYSNETGRYQFQQGPTPARPEKEGKVWFKDDKLDVTLRYKECEVVSQEGEFGKMVDSAIQAMEESNKLNPAAAVLESLGYVRQPDGSWSNKHVVLQEEADAAMEESYAAMEESYAAAREQEPLIGTDENLDW